MSSITPTETTRRGAFLGIALLLGTGLLLSRPAHAEEPLRRVPTNCTGWAVPGVLLGAVGGSLLAQGSLSLAGEDLSSPHHAAQNNWLLGGTILLGASAGPILTCGLFDKEPYAIPKASFVVAGMSLGAISSFVPWMAIEAAREKSAGGTEADKAARGEGGAVIGVLLGTVGALAGSVGGYFLHEAVFHRAPRKGVTAKVVPLAAPGSVGAFLSGTF